MLKVERFRGSRQATKENTTKVHDGQKLFKLGSSLEITTVRGLKRGLRNSPGYARL